MTRHVLSAATAANAGDYTFDLRAIILSRRNDEDQTPECRAPAWPQRVPIETVGTRSTLRGPEFRKRIAVLAPDLIVVACFPWRLPNSILTIPRFGCLNVHPSLLPEGRGPEPVFWAIRRGLRETGVTIHRMDAGLDTGPILAQESFPIAADATLPLIEVDLARAGGRLLHGVVRDVAAGRARERTQPSGAWPDAPFPAGRDLVATTEWPASRVARYIRAVAPAHGPVSLLIAATGAVLPWPFAGEDVIAVDDLAIQQEPLRWDGDSVRIRCTPGVIEVGVPRRSTPLILHPPLAPRLC